MSIQDISDICRTCLSTNSKMYCLYDVETSLDQSKVIGEVLMSCTAVQISKDDSLPEQLCMLCIQELHRTVSFKSLCERSDSTLRSYLQNLIDNKYDLESENLDIEESNIQNRYEIKTGDNINLADNLIILDVVNEANITHLNGNDTEIEDVNAVANLDCTDESKYYSCQECDEKFLSESALQEHNKSHNLIDESECKTNRKNMPKTCETCNKTFRFHSNLERHKLVHTGEKPYLCNVCGKGFAQLSYLKIHSFIHTGEKPYVCHLCDRCFAAPGTLMTHIRTHTGERPHVCKICGKDFPQSGYLSAHIRTHTGEKPIECNLCHRRFNQSGRLLAHMRIHSGEKPYSCEDCGRSFAVHSTLKKHVRTHTGEKPYVCSECGRAFTQSGTLTTHMKRHKKIDKALS